MSRSSELQQRLEEAETALHRLMLGEREVTVSVGGFGATSYSEVSMDKLKLYIAHLKQAIARQSGKPKRGPLWVHF